MANQSLAGRSTMGRSKMGQSKMGQSAAGRDEAGFTLIEAVVALGIVVWIVISYIGIRTTALIDATQARNWRLARELAEEKMSELAAGARETPPESEVEVPFEKYPDWSFKIVIGEAAVSRLEGEVATSSAGSNTEASERLDWQRDRQDFQRAQQRGLSATEYRDQQAEEDYRRRTEDRVPSEDEFEDVAVAIYFPKLNAEFEGEREALVIKAKLSTLAIQGLTPEEAAQVAEARSVTPASAGDGGGSSNGGGAK